MKLHNPKVQTPTPVSATVVLPAYCLSLALRMLSRDIEDLYGKDQGVNDGEFIWNSLLQFWEMLKATLSALPEEDDDEGAYRHYLNQTNLIVEDSAAALLALIQEDAGVSVVPTLQLISRALHHLSLEALPFMSEEPA